MRILKPLVIVVAGLTMGLSGAAFAKGHDQGVADGTRGGLDSLPPGGAAGSVDDLVRGPEGRGRASNPDTDFVYGRDVVREGLRPSVDPKSRRGGFPPGNPRSLKPEIGR